MSDHFSIDVDVDSLRAAEQWLGEIATHASAEGANIGSAPDNLGSWTGGAATKIKGEMSALGSTVAGFETKLTSVRDAVRTFANAAEEFRDTTLVTYNDQWQQAHANATADIEAVEKQAADDGDDSGIGEARGQIVSGLRYTLMGLTHQFGEEKRALATKAQTLGVALGSSSPIPVPDSVAARFVSGGGSGNYFSWCDMDGVFPPDLDANGQLAGTSLSEDVDQAAAGEETAERLNSGDLTPEEAARLADEMDPDSEAFRAAFIDALEPEKLAEFHEYASQPGYGEEAAGFGALITAVGTVLSQGSRPENQRTYPVDDSVYDDIADAYTEVENEYDPGARTRGYLRLSELIAAGQGEPPTWNSDFLAEVTRRTIAYEREQVEIDDYWSWGNALSGPGAGMSFVTEKGASWYGDTSETTNPAWGDPLVLYFEAMANDTEAAQQTFTDGTSALDQDLSDYLYGRTAGHAGNYGWALSQVLQSATQPVGPGGEGSPDHISASIVADMVGYYAENEIGLNMEDGIVNILTNHVQSVNHATDENTGFEGLVVDANENSNFPHEWITKANLTQQDVAGLLTQVFGLDYYSNQIAEDADPPGHDFPRYAQLALAMELAAREEVHYVAQHGDPGQLETLVNDLSQSQQRTLNAFSDALEGQGRDSDERNADSRAALDFVLGIAKDQIPTGKGLPSSLAGEGLDRVQDLLVDTIIPETDYEAAAREDVSVEEYRQQLTSLKLVKWLDEAGALPPSNSPQQWADENPDFDSFLSGDGELIDPGELYRNKDGDPDAWNDFLRYYENSGRAWLAEIDLDEQYTLGWLEEGG